MMIKLCLFTCALTMGQTVDRNLWQLTPRFARGQELVYSGSYEEESLAPGVHFRRRFRLQTRAVVLKTTTKGWDVGFLTSLQLRRQNQLVSPKKDPQNVASVRLRLARVDRQGKVSANGSALLMPIDGPPTVEMGCVLAVPPGRIGIGSQWAVIEPGRPALTWRVSGSETVSSTRCLKIVGTQQSVDWATPRADQIAWKRTETVWLAPRTGVVYKVERVIELRDAGRTRPTSRRRVAYELDRSWIYPARLFENHQQEILQISRLTGEAEKYLRFPNRYRSQLDAVLTRIKRELERRREQDSLPRRALEQTQHRVEAVLRGEVVVAIAKKVPMLIPQAEIGKRAPDFLVTNLLSKKSERLYEYLGRPVFIVFYNPKTVNGIHVLKFARQIREKYQGKVTILGMAVSHDIGYVRRQHAEMRLDFAILDGKGLHRTFGVDATPRLILLDAQGTVLAAQTGWGRHVPQELLSVLESCFKKMD